MQILNLTQRDKFLLIISALFNIPNLVKKLPWVVIKDFKLQFANSFLYILKFIK